MNNYLILLLAVCLVSVHAFVKRDAPEAPKDDNILEKMSKQLNDTYQQFSGQLSKSLDPDTIKKNINDMINTVNKAFNDMKPKETPKE